MKGFWLGLTLAEALMIGGTQLSYDKAVEYETLYRTSGRDSDPTAANVYNGLTWLFIKERWLVSIIRGKYIITPITDVTCVYS